MENEGIFTGDLRHVDFSGRDLRGAIFHQADLYRAQFAGSVLENAVFVDCFAAEANFAKASCVSWRARHCNFYRASFAGSNLSGALLWQCNLAAANLQGATLHDLTVTLNCGSFEDVELDAAAGAELAYLFSRANSPHRAHWLEHVADRNLARLEKVFSL